MHTALNQHACLASWLVWRPPQHRPHAATAKPPLLPNRSRPSPSSPMPPLRRPPMRLATGASGCWPRWAMEVSCGRGGDAPNLCCNSCGRHSRAACKNHVLSEPVQLQTSNSRWPWLAPLAALAPLSGWIVGMWGVPRSIAVYFGLVAAALVPTVLLPLGGAHGGMGGSWVFRGSGRRLEGSSWHSSALVECHVTLNLTLSCPTPATSCRAGAAPQPER